MGLDGGRRNGLRHLLLLGAGPANLYVLQQLAKSRPADLKISIVVTTLPALLPRLLLGWATGQHELQACEMPLEALAQACQARILASPCQSLSATEQRLLLADGQALRFDLLLLDIEADIGRARSDMLMPGARQHALFLHPLKQFASLWPRLRQMARERAIHLVVVGGGGAGYEWLMAAASELRQPHGSRMSWVTQSPLEAVFPVPAQRRSVQTGLRRQRVTLLQASCIGFNASEVLLDNGARLACDAPLLAGPCTTPEWLHSSDLALDASGRVLVDAQGHSRSHRQVLAVNEAASIEFGAAGTNLRYPDPVPKRLLCALRAALAEQAATAAVADSPGATPGLELMASGRGRAIASWRGFCIEGRIPWSIRQALDRRFLRSLESP